MKILKCIKEENDFFVDLTVGEIYEISKKNEYGFFTIIDDYWKNEFSSLEEFLKTGIICVISERLIKENFEVVE